MSRPENSKPIHILWEATLRGSYPSIPLPEDINVEDFGPDPMFVTLPIMPVGARSRNERTYTRPAVEAIVRQVNENRPSGFWGHLPIEDYANRYDVPAVRWLAAQIVDDMAWGKLVAITTEAKEHFRTAKAANARVGTSIYAWGEMEGENVITLDLESIDLADPARVGILAAVAVPQVTAEMAQVNEAGEADMAGSLQEIEKERDALRAQVAELQGKLDEQRDYGRIAASFYTYFGEGTDAAALMKSIYEALGAMQRDLNIDGSIEVAVVDMQRMVNELATGQRRAAVQAVVAELVPDEALRALVADMLDDSTDAKTARAKIEKIQAGETYQKLAKTLTVAEMGGPAVAAAKVSEKADRDAQLDELEKKGRETAKHING